MRRSLAALVGAVVAACSGAEESSSATYDELRAKADDHWFYTGTLPKLDDARVTVALKGHTVRVSGTVPSTMLLPELPHVRTKPEGDKTRVDVVYPIATAGPNKDNSDPGRYFLYSVKPYKPSSLAWTPDEGDHFVTWGGFPFLEYNDGIAFHGPITDMDNRGRPDVAVWYLLRGPVSGGCNRMLGEHVVELAHVVGVPMNVVYREGKAYRMNEAPVNVTAATVRVVPDYDSYDGKYVDVDYPTAAGAKRPKDVYGEENVAMFGSWIASETPDGTDLPHNLKWESGIRGKYYVFADHVRPHTVCSMPKAVLSKLRNLVGVNGGVVPKNLCERQACWKEKLSGSEVVTPASCDAAN